MKTASEIEEKILQLENKLREIDGIVENEMKRRISHRNEKTFMFLDSERKKYTSLLSTLKWVLEKD